MSHNLLEQFKSSKLAIWAACTVLAGSMVWLLTSHFGIDLIFLLVPVAVCAFLSYRIHLSRLAEKTREITEVSRVHLATVEAMATAIDARDQIGIGHVRRTQIYAVGLGRLLNMESDEIDALRTAALLHDIGKLAVPEHILNKAGGLTPAELEKTKIHPEVAALILGKVGFTTPVIPTIKYHHERWDGRGYPEGLERERIPMTARVLAVADAFDTMRGARPYRAAIARDKARNMIQSEAGVKFDPQVVDALLRNLSTLEAEIQRSGLWYADSDAVGPANSQQNFVEQIKLANREVFSLYELAREFSSALDLTNTLEMFTRKIGELVPFDTCAIYLMDHSERSATAAHVEGSNADLLRLRQVRVGQGATGFTLKEKRTVQNLEPDLDFQYSQAELTQLYLTMAAVPLIADGELLGAVTIYSQQLDAYGEEHIRLLETLSRIASDAISKSLKHDEVTTHAMTDPMTGLPNARSLQRQFEKEVSRSSRTGTSFQVLMLDLDGFKAVNDTYGHKAGDELLREVSKVIREQLREYDFLARYGGDEFVALVPETTGEDVRELCDRIEESVSAFRLPVGEGKYASVGVSLGSAGYPENGESFDQMIIAADRLMYERKMVRKRIGRQPAPPPPSELVLRRDGSVVIGPASAENLIVELDESHVLAASAALN